MPYHTYGAVPISNSTVTLDITPQSLSAWPLSVPSSDVAATHILALGKVNTAHNWFLSNGTQYPDDWRVRHPLLYAPNSTASLNESLVVRTENGTWIDTWIDIVVRVLFDPARQAAVPRPHPIHKHSNKAYIIGSRVGEFTGSSVAEAQQAVPQFFDFDTPILRDTFTTRQALFSEVWVTFRYQVVNPGAFLLHCHINTHPNGGMAVALLDGIDEWPVVIVNYAAGANGL